MLADYYTALLLINCPPLLKAGPGMDPGFSGERVRINFPKKSTVLVHAPPGKILTSRSSEW